MDKVHKNRQLHKNKVLGYKREIMNNNNLLREFSNLQTSLLNNTALLPSLHTSRAATIAHLLLLLLHLQPHTRQDNIVPQPSSSTTRTLTSALELLSRKFQ